MLERETERLSAHLETLFFKVVENDIMISCIRARHVPQRISTPEIKLPEWQDGCGVGSVAWYECWKALAETKRECFGNVGHICKYSPSAGHTLIS
jgi:hypothetical protein